MMMPNIVKLLIAVLATAVLSLLQCKVNLHKKNRKKQVSICIAAIIYSILASIIILIYQDSILSVFQFVEKGDSLSIFILNLAIGVCFFIIKTPYCVVRTLVEKRLKSEKDHTNGRFYEYDTDCNEWFLLEKWKNIREIFKAFTIIGALIFGLFYGITWCTGPGSFFWVYLFPIVIQIVIAEIYNYLNGYTKREYNHDVFGDDANFQKISNFYKTREIYEKLFPHELLSANTAADYLSRDGASDKIEKLGKSEKTVERITAQFFSQHESEEDYDVDSLDATLHLMKKQNVIFFNPFYRDLGKYLILPITRTLLSGKKMLVILGRASTTKDIKSWIKDLIVEYSGIRSFWRVETLSPEEPDCEVGILEFSQLYDLRTVEVNRSFFEDTGFALILEPSLFVDTGQIGVRVIAEELEKNDKPIYCVADRMTDGLVDTLSHLLHTEFLEVTAAPVPRCIYTSMSWNADGDFLRQELFDKETKYLGNGIELASVAIKNQVPFVTWYGEKKAPIKDIKWIAGQYYPVITGYMNVPAQQQSLYNKINFVSNMWLALEEKEQFIIVEDEFCNMFHTMRTYMSRGRDQTFVNILSENYLFRDYMRCNPQLFISNPNAIPAIVPDYVTTERNAVYKLLFLMATRPVKEADLKAELKLTADNIDNVFESFVTLLKKYTFVDESILSIKTMDSVAGDHNLETVNTYEISKQTFNKYFSQTLKIAYFILEDEEYGANYVDAKLYGHITQSTLPGQFLTYGGKYYKVKSISADGDIILRRASDLYDGRKYYRQIRKYRFENIEDNIVTIYSIMDIEIVKLCRDIIVETSGYLDMKSNNDLRTARLIDFTNDHELKDKFTRKYRNKNVLRIRLPETNDKIRFTFCLLLTEAFRTIFPDSWQYIAVVSARPKNIDGMLNYTVYSIEGDYDEEYVYIIEDSDIDLGLLEAIEKNLMRLMEIISDFLDWHFEKMKEPPQKDPVLGKVILPEDQKRKSLRSKMLQRIRQLFGVKKEAEVIIPPVKNAEEQEPEEESNISEIATVTNEANSLKESAASENDIKESGDNGGETTYSLSDEDEASDENTLGAEKIAEPIEEKIHEEADFIPNVGENPDFVAIDGTDIFDHEGTSDEELFLEESFKDLGIEPVEKTRYQKECFLKYGFEEIDSRICIEELKDYLTVRGWSSNSLREARKREVLPKVSLDFEAANHCDFCGKPLSGVSYEKLNDGRIRCNDCGLSAINTTQEFTALFQNVLATMESFFGIGYKVAVTVKMTDAKTVAKGAGSVFVPSTELTARVLGFAQRKKDKYSLVVENGSPRLAAINTMVHEMTHIWQYLKWDDNEIIRLYGKDRNRDLVYEGMAMWVSIQYLYLIGENSYAYQQECITEQREDIYGEGFKLFKEKYPLIKDFSLVKLSPFSTFPPL